MTVKNIERDLDNLTLTFTTTFETTVERAWQLWADPRQLERWWGPPTYPATFVEHDLTDGGTVAYFMTGPEGDTFHGWWRIVAVDAPNGMTFEDGFANDEGTPNLDLPVTTIRVTIAPDPAGSGVEMVVSSAYTTLEGMQQVLDMGMEEGMTQAMGQIDAILAASPAAT